MAKEISCRITRTLLMYVSEKTNGALGNLLDGLPLDENYLMDTNNWVSHGFLWPIRLSHNLPVVNFFYKVRILLLTS